MEHLRGPKYFYYDVDFYNYIDFILENDYFGQYGHFFNKTYEARDEGYYTFDSFLHQLDLCDCNFDTKDERMECYEDLYDYYQCYGVSNEFLENLG